jgi:hypothetical protein
MSTCGILSGTPDGISPIISHPSVFSKTLRRLLVQERGSAGPKRIFNGGFALEISANVWNDIS